MYNGVGANLRLVLLLMHTHDQVSLVHADDFRTLFWVCLLHSHGGVA
jgi:hypothetical protein